MLSVAFVTLDSATAASTAVASLNGLRLSDREVFVKIVENDSHQLSEPAPTDSRSKRASEGRDATYDDARQGQGAIPHGGMQMQMPGAMRMHPGMAQWGWPGMIPMAGLYPYNTDPYAYQEDHRRSDRRSESRRRSSERRSSGDRRGSESHNRSESRSSRDRGRERSSSRRGRDDDRDSKRSRH